MPAYRVKFVNKLLTSDGHPVSAVQRVVRVPQAESPDDACRQAQAQFCKLEHVAHWTNHAQHCECELDEPAPDTSKP